MMKKNYFEPSINICMFINEDVVTSSGEPMAVNAITSGSLQVDNKTLSNNDTVAFTF